MESGAMMTIAKLLYCVINIRSFGRDDWVVRCERECYGPFPTRGAASARATIEAAAANRLGFLGVVRVRSTWTANWRFLTMVEDSIGDALRAVDKGFIAHVHPFTWEWTVEARHIDPRTLQRALQQGLIAVEKNADGTSRPAALTSAGRARLGRPPSWPLGGRSLRAV